MPGRANSTDQLSKEKQTLLLLNQILWNTKQFAAEKVVNFEEIVDEWQGLDDPFEAKELYHEFKTRLLGPNTSTKYENDCKSAVLYPTLNKTILSLPQRLKRQRKEYGKFLKTEEEFTIKMIETYSQWNNPKRNMDPWEEFSKLDALNGQFLKFLKSQEEEWEMKEKPLVKAETDVDMMMDCIARGNKFRQKSLSHNLPTGMVKDNPELGKLVKLLPINPKYRFPSPAKSEEAEWEGDSEAESECSDYFAGVRPEEQKVVKHHPPQNKVRLKNLSMIKKKYSKASFRSMERQKQEIDPDFKYFEIV